MCAWPSPFFRQAWTISGVLLNVLGQGMLMGYISCLQEGLTAPDSPIKIDLDTAFWIGSLPVTTIILGICISSYLMERLGRRLSYTLLLLPAIVGLTLVYCAKNISMVLAGKALGGITSGASISGCIIIGEFSSPEHRGTFLVLIPASFYLGSAVMNAIGNFQWRTLSLFCLIPGVLSLVVACTWPESPAWLAKTKQFYRAEHAFFWLRGKGASRKEIQRLIKSYKEVPDRRRPIYRILMIYFHQLLRKVFLKPIFILFLSILMSEACSKHIFLSASNILGYTDKLSFNFFYLDLGILVTIIISSLLIKILRLRTLLLATGVSAVLVLTVFCIYIYLESLNLIANFEFIPISLLLVYFILVNLGCVNIVYLLLGELLPLSLKSVGNLIVALIYLVILNINIKLAPYLFSTIQVYGTFAIYGVITALVLLILYFMLPETKDRTLQEIEYYLSDGQYVEDIDNDIELRIMNN